MTGCSWILVRVNIYVSWLVCDGRRRLRWNRVAAVTEYWQRMLCFQPVRKSVVKTGRIICSQQGIFREDVCAFPAGSCALIRVTNRNYDAMHLLAYGLPPERHRCFLSSLLADFRSRPTNLSRRLPAQAFQLNPLCNALHNVSTGYRQARSRAQAIARGAADLGHPPSRYWLDCRNPTVKKRSIEFFAFG